MAELADALASGASSRKGVEVRVLSWAPYSIQIHTCLQRFEFYCMHAVMARLLLPARNEKRDGHARTDFAILLRSVNGREFWLHGQIITIKIH